MPHFYIFTYDVFNINLQKYKLINLADYSEKTHKMSCAHFYDAPLKLIYRGDTNPTTS